MFTPALKFVIWLVLVLLVVLLGILMHKYPKSRFIYTISYIISGSTLLFYPAILAAGIMGFASISLSEITSGTVILLLFLALTLLQPFIYIICFVITIKCLKRNKASATISLLPFVAPGLIATVLLLL